MIPRNLVLSVVVMGVIAAAMSLYVWRVRGRVTADGPVAASNAPVAPPVSGPAQDVTLYVAYDDREILKAQSFRIPLPSEPQARASELLRFLVAIYDGSPSPHPLGKGSEVRNVYIVNPDLAVIDLNGAFATGHPSGVLVEELTVASLVESLSANLPVIKRVKIVADGKTQATLAGHADLEGLYDVSAVHELAGSLQTGR
jgi:hypothetical protein